MAKARKSRAKSKKQLPATNVKHEARRAGGYSGKVAVDFDGVLHDYTLGWTGYEPIGDPIEGALDFINAVFAKGYEPVVFSARADTNYGVVCIERWLVKHGFPVLRVFPKMNAIAYVDDRGVHCDPAMGGEQDGFAFALTEIQRLADIRREVPLLTVEQRAKIFGQWDTARADREADELSELGIKDWKWDAEHEVEWPVFDDAQGGADAAADAKADMAACGSYPWDR